MYSQHWQPTVLEQHSVCFCSLLGVREVSAAFETHIRFVFSFPFSFPVTSSPLPTPFLPRTLSYPCFSTPYRPAVEWYFPVHPVAITIFHSHQQKRTLHTKIVQGGKTVHKSLPPPLLLIYEAFTNPPSSGHASRCSQYTDTWCLIAHGGGSRGAAAFPGAADGLEPLLNGWLLSVHDATSTRTEVLSTS